MLNQEEHIEAADRAENGARCWPTCDGYSKVPTKRWYFFQGKLQIQSRQNMLSMELLAVIPPGVVGILLTSL